VTPDFPAAADAPSVRGHIDKVSGDGATENTRKNQKMRILIGLPYHGSGGRSHCLRLM
jgi:hypothetical protein